MNSDKVGRIPPPTKRLVVRKANSHRDLRPLTERATLEKVLGLTVSKNAALACDPGSGIIAYPAGCVVVLFNPRKNKQSFILNTSKKTITSLAFSGDGKYLATGESGHLPSVRVWDIEDPSHPQVAEMTKGHKFGVACVAFSPNLKYVASVGFQHDMIVNIWNWKTSVKVASNKVSSKVSALSFSENGSYFVTVGVRHVKFWYFDTESNKSKVSKTLVINGRAALLGEQRNNTFCDVACGRGLNSDITYCVTSSGLLCSINSKRVLDTWVELKTSNAHAVAVSEHYIVCGCADGIIRVFNPLKLQHIVTLPKPHFLGVNIAEGIDFSNPLSKPEKAAYPDTVAVALDTVNHRLTCVYNDHSLYTWDVKDIKRIGKTWSSLYHSTCVWGIEVYPIVGDNREAALPPGSFLTCSSDDTIRVWNIEEGTSVLFERNVYSKETMKIIYTDETVANLKDTDISPAIKNMRDSTSDSRNSGVRCLRISPDGQTLATGDRSGNVRVYDLMFYDETAKIEAHESEVLCVEFSPNESGHKLLASAGRDRLIHIFDIQNNFSFVQTLDDHSASITSIKFNLSESDELQLLSCGADKSIIFRTAQQNPELQFVRTTNYVGKTTFYDMDIDFSRKHAATACQDRNVRVYDVNSGKQTRTFKGTPGDDGTLVRITLDSSGTYVATSCSDKSVCITDFDTGECVASMSGHSEVVTGIKFSVDCKNLISVCGDGCVFVWKIPSTYTQNMVEKLQALGHEPEIKFQFGTPLRRDTYKVTHPSIPEETEFLPAEPSAFSRPVREPSPPVNYRFSVGQLPAWAKKQLITEDDKTSVSADQDNTQQTAQPGGRWAQRVQGGGIHVAGENGTLQPIAFPLNPADQKRYTIEPISVQEQMRALANSPLERRCSLTKGEDDDLFPLDCKAAFDGLIEDNAEDEGTSEAPPGVRVSRGSDVTMYPSRKSSVVTLETEELKFEEAEEVEGLNEGEMKEVIIYLPPSQDDFDSEVANAPRVQEIVHHYEAMQLNHHLSLPNIAQPTSNGVQDDSSPDEPDEPVIDTPPRKNSSGLYRSPSVDYLPSRLQTFLRAFQLSAAQHPKRLSLTVEDSKGEEQEENSNSKLGEKETRTPSSEDSDEEVTSPVEDISKPFGENDNRPEGREDEAMVGRYFETLGTSSPGPKSNEQETEPPPLDTERLMRTRLSISARFLSRSNQPGRIGSLAPSLDEETSRTGNSTSDDSKQDFQRRKEEMALAVEATRKRLEALGWKAKEDILKKLPTNSTTCPVPSVSNVVSSTENTASSTGNATVTTVSSTPCEAVTATSQHTPVSSLSESSSKPSVITNLLETRLADVRNNKDTKKEQIERSVKKEVAGEKKENQSKDEDGDKSKRSASHLISFFSQSKSSKNKDKEKENKEKEKDKSKAKDKEKGRSTPPPDKQASEAKPTPGANLERKGSTGSTASQKSEGKSWRKSLGILGGSSKQDKEEKLRKSTDHRTSTLAEVSTKHSNAATTNEENNTLMTAKDTKEDKSNIKLPERRGSTPTAEVLKKNSQVAPPAQDDGPLKPVIEDKQEKLNKKQSERRSSTPKTRLQMKNVQPTTNKHDGSSLKSLKEDKEVKLIKKESENRSLTHTEESRTKNCLDDSGNQNEPSSLIQVKDAGEISNKTETNPGVRRTNENTSTVQLRGKKGRSTSGERREKAKSLGDISNNLEKVEVSILDPTVPPSRTVDTMDIPNQLAHHSRRPMSSNAMLETFTSKNKPSDGKSLDAKNMYGVNTFNDHLGMNDALNNSEAGSSLNGNLLENQASESSARSEDEQILASEPAPEKKFIDQETSKVTFPAKNTRSRSGSSFMSDINELSAELSAAIASPPPQLIRVSMSESSLLASGPSLGKKQSSVESICQEALENLGKAFQNVMDLHFKVLDEEPSAENHRLLSHISGMLSSMEEQIHESRVRRRHWELSHLSGGNPGVGSRPLGGTLSMSTGNLDQVVSKGPSLRRHSEFSISSIPEVDTEVHEVLLETHFNKLLEMLSQRLSK